MIRVGTDAGVEKGRQRLAQAALRELVDVVDKQRREKRKERKKMDTLGSVGPTVRVGCK